MHHVRGHPRPLSSVDLFICHEVSPCKSMSASLRQKLEHSQPKRIGNVHASRTNGRLFSNLTKSARSQYSESTKRHFQNVTHIASWLPCPSSELTLWSWVPKKWSLCWICRSGSLLIKGEKIGKQAHSPHFTVSFVCFEAVM